MTTKFVHEGCVSTPGDIRALGRGDYIRLDRTSAFHMKNWAVYWDAIGVAMARGAVLES